MGASVDAEGGQQPPSDQELWDVVGKLELPMILIDLNDLTVSAVSKAALKRIGVPSSAVLGRSALQLLFHSEDRANAQRALEALRDGVIDFYQAHRLVGPIETPESLTAEWVRGIDFGDRRLALVQAAAGREPRHSPLVEYLGYKPLKMAIGTMGSDCVVTAVSNDITDIFGFLPGDLIGRPLFDTAERSDVCSFLDTLDDGGDCSVSLHIRLKDAAGAETRLSCILTSLADSPSKLFILIRDQEIAAARGADRTAQLEQHLWRIAGEVQASGILKTMDGMPDMHRFPQIGTLSTRQWEVLSRLMRGERVPTIAQELVVSQSTVRNYLSAIFEKFGVHSQAELLALLTKPDRSTL